MRNSRRRVMQKLNYSVDASFSEIVQNAEKAKNRVFHKKSVENLAKKWKTRNGCEICWKKIGCKLKVTHTFHRNAVENSENG